MAWATHEGVIPVPTLPSIEFSDEDAKREATAWVAAEKLQQRKIATAGGLGLGDYSGVSGNQVSKLRRLGVDVT